MNRDDKSSGTAVRTSRARTRLRRTMCTAVGALLLGACGGDGGSGPAASTISGTYTLVTFDGKAVPTVVYEDDEWRDEVLYDRLIFRSNGTFTNAYSYRYTHKPSAEVQLDSDAIEGTYIRDGADLSLQFATNDVGDFVQARISGDRITIRNQVGAPYVFQKE